MAHAVFPVATAASEVVVKSKITFLVWASMLLKDRAITGNELSK